MTAKHPYIHGPAGFTAEIRRSIKEIEKRKAALGAPAIPLRLKPMRRERLAAARLGGPQTLAALGIACGKYHDAAINDAQWRGLAIWVRKAFMGYPPCPKFPNTSALYKCWAADGDRLGFPQLPGIPSDAGNVGVEDRAAGEHILAVWTNTGRPYLAHGIAAAYQHIQSYLGAISSVQAGDAVSAHSAP